MDNDTEAPKDPGVKDNQRYTEQDFEGNTDPQYIVYRLQSFYIVDKSNHFSHLIFFRLSID